MSLTCRTCALRSTISVLFLELKFVVAKMDGIVDDWGTTFLNLIDPKCLLFLNHIRHALNALCSQKQAIRGKVGVSLCRWAHYLISVLTFKLQVLAHCMLMVPVRVALIFI